MKANDYRYSSWWRENSGESIWKKKSTCYLPFFFSLHFCSSYIYLDCCNRPSRVMELRGDACLFYNFLSLVFIKNLSDFLDTPTIIISMRACTRRLWKIHFVSIYTQKLYCLVCIRAALACLCSICETQASRLNGKGTKQRKKDIQAAHVQRLMLIFLILLICLLIFTYSFFF